MDRASFDDKSEGNRNSGRSEMQLGFLPGDKLLEKITRPATTYRQPVKTDIGQFVTFVTSTDI